MPAHILLATFLATPPDFVDDYDPKEPAGYATIKLGKGEVTWDAQFSPDGKTLAYNESGKRIVLWDVAKKKETAEFKADPDRSYHAMAWQPDGKALIAGEFGRVYHIDVPTGERKKVYTHDSTVRVIRYLPEQKLIVSSGDSDGCVKFWGVEKEKVVKEVRYADKNFVHDISFAPKTSKLVVSAQVPHDIVGGDGRTVHSSDDVVFTIDLKDYSVKTVFDDSPLAWFMTMTATQAGEMAYGKGKRVAFTNLATRKTCTTDKGPIWPERLLFTPNDRYLIVVGMRPHLIPATYSPGGMAVYDMKAEKWGAYWELMADGRWVTSYSESANLIAYGSDRCNILTIWDMTGVIDPAAKPKAK
jgi:dipeptidyl aminopeptidase/acylaminoacyl peptidase